MIKFIKKFKIIIIILLVVLLAASYFLFKGKEKIEYTTIKVAKGNLIQTVSEVGTVKAAKEIELNFLQSGKISSLPVKIGDKAEEGKILAELDYSSLSIKEQEAQANLDVANANLNKLLAGATSQEIAVSQAQVDQAKASYSASLAELERIKNKIAEDISQAEKTLADLEDASENSVTPYEQSVVIAQTDLANTKSTYQQSIDNKKNVLLSTIDNKLVVANTALDNVNTILDDDDAREPMEAKDKTYLVSAETSHANGLAFLAIAKNKLSTAEAAQSNDNISSSSQSSLSALNEVFKSLDYCYKALEGSIVSYTFTQAELDAYKATISAQITAISSAISSLQTAQHNFEDAVLTYQTKVAEAENNLTKAQVNLDDAKRSARNNLASLRVSGDQQIGTVQTKVDNSLESWQVAKMQFIQLKSPARSQDISLYRAQVKQAEAALNLAKKQIEDSIIKAPIAGTVIRVEYEVGEQVSAAKPVVAILGENNFETEVDISEADIAKIKIGNPVEITLDALGDETKFSGRIYSIEPAETIIQDVIYYKVKVEFSEENINYSSNFKPGMTANVIITTNSRKDVLFVPSRAVIEKNGDGKYVRILLNGKAVETPVEIGLKGDEGFVEILSGIKAGDEVITFEKSSN
ncbi:MAG: efflux RND transporter periplasmic adaptor subunit [Patescibacteria group bacterium]